MINKSLRLVAKLDIVIVLFNTSLVVAVFDIVESVVIKSWFLGAVKVVVSLDRVASPAVVLAIVELDELIGSCGLDDTLAAVGEIVVS